MAEDEQALIERFRRGDEAAFTELFDRLFPAVYRYAVHLVTQASDAEEIAQETFLKAYFSRRSFRGDSGLKTWLFRIARNRCLDLLRRRRFGGFSWNLTRRPDARNIPEEISTPAPTPDRVAEGRETVARLEHLIATLPEESRSVLFLHALEGMTDAEISASTGFSLSKIKVLLHRTRRYLTEKIS